MLFFFSNAFIFNEASRLWGLKKSMNTDIKYDIGIVLGGVADYDKKSNLLNFNNYSDRLFFAKKLFINKKINKIISILINLILRQTYIQIKYSYFEQLVHYHP